ncbi:hypothetical protein FQR65_LT14576 [Abscondita terminalis]|nr:hypothetical protein FQR65_LT14576 [Abscondita terminalis]
MENFEINLQRRNANNRLTRQLRDHSNPFNMPNEVFRRLYRFSPELAHQLFLEIAPLLEDGVRRTKIPKVVRFLVTLHFYSQGSYQKSVGTDSHCSMSQPAVSRCIKEISDTIVTHFSGRYIKFPVTLNEIINVKNGFFEKFNFPGIVGVIDGTHVSIVAPVFGRIPPRAVFLNRKNYYSINCQLICDSDLKILSLCAQYPGSVHDSAIWMMSNIFQELKNRYRNGERSSWLIGDSGYPLQPFLLTPILNAPEGTMEDRYTRRLCRARNSVERCIGVLKGTFRCLIKDRTLHYKPRDAAKIIITCATLYNILKDANADINEYAFEEDDGVNNQINNDELYNAGLNIRNNLILNHFQ